ncbi:MAG: 23S rRNA (guanosine(2251)-2'-O)-methyltransferase RlmB [Pseudanabaenaceae cyanobacterium bins.39]|nr:23S rRNA (guanosine(2251)-2'-O)-methyltransferase RlmB [Pseudanabaenaceae cyanobacterium bins.39]
MTTHPKLKSKQIERQFEGDRDRPKRSENQSGRYADKQSERRPEKRSGKYADQQTDRRYGKQTDKYADKYSDKQHRSERFDRSDRPERPERPAKYGQSFDSKFADKPFNRKDQNFERPSEPRYKSRSNEDRRDDKRSEYRGGSSSKYAESKRSGKHSEQRHDRRSEPRFSYRDDVAPVRVNRLTLPAIKAIKQDDAPEPQLMIAAPDLNPDAPDIIYGRHAVEAVLKSDRSINRVWVTARMRYAPDFLHLIDEAKAAGAVIDEVDNARLDRITDRGRHQGLAVQVSAYEYADLDEVIASAKQKSSQPVIVIADGITDPHNLGAIIRSAAAMGANALVIPQRRAVGITATVAKVAAGTLEILPVVRVVNLNRALETIKEAGFWVYGTSADASAPIHKTKFDGAIALVVGAEGEGLSLSVQKNCDFLVSIPLEGKVESLNASVATGMALYEIFRQRWQNTLNLNNLS